MTDNSKKQISIIVDQIKRARATGASTNYIESLMRKVRRLTTAKEQQPMSESKVREALILMAEKNFQEMQKKLAEVLAEKASAMLEEKKVELSAKFLE